MNSSWERSCYFRGGSMNKMRIVLLALAIVFTLSTATSGLRAVSKTRSQAPSSSAPNKRALLVGINKYKYSNVIPTLSGSINDVEDMKALLIGKFGFPPENVQVLTDEKATHLGIVSAIETHLINKTQPGDIVVFHYSGH